MVIERSSIDLIGGIDGALNSGNACLWYQHDNKLANLAGVWRHQTLSRSISKRRRIGGVFITWHHATA